MKKKCIYNKKVLECPDNILFHSRSLKFEKGVNNNKEIEKINQERRINKRQGLEKNKIEGFCSNPEFSNLAQNGDGRNRNIGIQWTQHLQSLCLQIHPLTKIYP